MIPVGQWGAQQRPFTVRRLLRRPLARLSVGTPVDLARFRGAEPTASTLREITDTIMGAIRDQVAELRNEQPPAEFFRPERKYVDRGRSAARG